MLGNCQIDILPWRTSITRVYSLICIYGISEIHACEVFLRIFVVQRLFWSIGGVSISTNNIALHKQDSTLLLLQKFSGLGIDFSKIEKKNIMFICWHGCGSLTDSTPRKTSSTSVYSLCQRLVTDLYATLPAWWGTEGGGACRDLCNRVKIFANGEVAAYEVPSKSSVKHCLSIFGLFLSI